jgi:hypothetical protein
MQEVCARAQACAVRVCSRSFPLAALLTACLSKQAEEEWKECGATAISLTQPHKPRRRGRTHAHLNSNGQYEGRSAPSRTSAAFFAAPFSPLCTDGRPFLLLLLPLSI